METKVTTPVIKAVIISLVLIVYSLVIQFSHQTQNKMLTVLPIIVFFGGIIWSAISFANQMQGNVSYGQVFSHAFKTAAGITVIMVIFTIVSAKLLFPESVEQGIEAARIEMEKKGMPDEQVEQALSLTRRFFIPFAIGGALLMYMIAGVIAGLIGAAVAKKNPESPFTNQV